MGAARLRGVEGLAEHEREFVQVVRTMAQERIAPIAEAIDRSNEFPKDVYRVFLEMGLVGLRVPEEYGGVGASLLLTSCVYEEIARASATAALILSNSVEALIPVVKFGSDPLRREAIARVLVGGEVPCFALTEPGAGSDATGISTTARPDGSDYVLRGRKCFITNGKVGGLFVVFAVTDPDARRSRRLSAFLVDRATPGFEIGKVEDTLGTRGSPLTELIFDDARVGADRMLGHPGDGLRVAMTMINESRVGAAAQCVGIAQDALDRSVKYAREREQFGNPIIDFQAVQVMLADMAIRTESARQLTHAAARAHDLGLDDAVQLSAMCKTLASDAAVANALDAIQIHGGYGYTRDFTVERLLRDAKAYQIFDGTNQIQRIAIAKSLRGAPHDAT